MKIKYLIIFLYITPIAALVPTFVPRSQSVNVAREMVGWQEYINRPDAQCSYGVFTITPEYTRSFNSGQLVECLFGDAAQEPLCGNRFITISGSRVPERKDSDWLADYFGLPTDFESNFY